MRLVVFHVSSKCVSKTHLAPSAGERLSSLGQVTGANTMGSTISRLRHKIFHSKYNEVEKVVIIQYNPLSERIRGLIVRNRRDAEILDISINNAESNVINLDIT